MTRRIIDMSHKILPHNEDGKFSIERVSDENDYKDAQLHEKHDFTSHKINMVSHLGTHIEAPLHIQKGGPDLSQLSLEKLCGEAVVLDLRGLPAKSIIHAEQVKEAEGKAGGIRHGDIVICNLGYADFFGTPKYADAPFFSTEAIEYLIGTGMKLIGLDKTDVELPEGAPHKNHHLLFDNGIPLIENLTGFNKLKSNRVKVYAFPIAVEGLESFPIRVVAIENE